MAEQFSGPIGQRNDCLSPALDSQTGPTHQAPDTGSFFVPSTRHDMSFTLVYPQPPDDASDEVVMAYQAGLPPLEFRQPEYRKESFKRLETPLDSRGLVDAKALLAIVNATMLPGYAWTGFKDNHHLHWKKSSYEAMVQEDPSSRALEFRNLPSNRIGTPRVLHSWIHAVTLEPPVPTRQVMLECWEESVLASRLYHSASDVMTQWRLYRREASRRGGFTPEQETLRDHQLRRKLTGVLACSELSRGIPVERLPFGVHMTATEAAGQVGDMVRQGHRRITKELRRGMAAREALAG